MYASPSHAPAETAAATRGLLVCPAVSVPHAAAMRDGRPVGELDAAGRPACPAEPGDPWPPYRPPTTLPLIPVPKFMMLPR